MRVVAGRWGGRPLRAPGGMSVRPTTDRVREAVFDILGARVEEARVLDLFAGTGALGIEALSRGAARAVFVEPGVASFAALSGNLASLGASGAEVLRTDYRGAIRALSRRGRTFDLVFLDPPYGTGLSAAASAALLRAGLVAPGGTAVVEESARVPEGGFPAPWARVDRRRYGDTCVTFYEFRGGPAEGPPERDRSE